MVETAYRILLHRRDKYRCRCNGQVLTAPGPQKLLPGGRYSIAFAQSTPSSRSSVIICRWRGKCARCLVRGWRLAPIRCGTNTILSAGDAPRAKMEVLVRAGTQRERFTSGRGRLADDGLEAEAGIRRRSDNQVASDDYGAQVRRNAVVLRRAASSTRACCHYCI